MRKVISIVSGLLLGLGFWGSLAAMAQPLTLGSLQISGAFTRAMPPQAPTGGGFVTITNTGVEDDRLVEVRSPVAEMVELHTMSMVDGVMKMGSSPEGFVIPAGEVIKLAPGGKHIMFMKVHTPFKLGEPVPVTLVFEHAGRIDIMLPVAPIGAKTYSEN